MNWQRLKEPAVLAAIAASMSCVLSLIVLAGRGDGSAPREGTLSAAELRELDDSLSQAELQLKKGGFGPALDLILVASRIAPSDPRVFDAALAFVERSEASGNDEAIAMGDDLLERSESLIHFQKPPDVLRARERLTALRNSLTKKASTSTAPLPFDSVLRLLIVAENKSLPAKIRSRAVEQARSRFTDTRVDQALATAQNGGKLDSEEAAKIEERIDAAEKQCVSELFLNAKVKIEQWVATATSLTKDVATAPSDKASSLSEKIVTLLNQGFGYLQEIMPFSQSGVEGAPDLYRAVDKELKLLERQKNWLYNQQVLAAR